MTTPYVLRPYQRRYLDDHAPVRLVVKSRRIGLTFADAAEATLCAAIADGGCDTWYSAQTADDTREYIEYVRRWARDLNIASQEIDGSQLISDEDGAAGVWAVRFASGHKVVTLTSNPRRLHGKAGRAVLDEAARYDRVGDFLEAALPLLMLGGRVSLISTESHSGTEFHRLRARLHEHDPALIDWSLHECFFDAALAEGFFRWHVMPARGLDPATWTLDLEHAYALDVRRVLGEHASSQLDGIPSGAEGLYIARELVYSASKPRPILRFVAQGHEDAAERARLIADWTAQVRALVFDATRLHAIGGDFGRAGDITAIAIVQTHAGARDVAALIEMRGVPYDVQRAVYCAAIDRAPRLCAVALDAGGVGSEMAESLEQRYGSIVERLAIGVGRARDDRPRGSVMYSELLPPVRAALQAGTLVIPRDDLVVQDLLGLRLVDGSPRVPSTRTRGSGGQRHCDAAVAIALGLLAAGAGGADWTTVERVDTLGAWAI